jgi:hypothetical protein
MRCNQCRVEVLAPEHKRIQHVLEAIIDAEVPGHDDLFVHAQGGDDEFDLDGAVVVCSPCFVMELYDNLRTYADNRLPEIDEPEVPSGGPD